jgi:AmmeMemoRadiSam system protein A
MELSAGNRHFLLALARETITRAAHQRELPPVDVENAPPALRVERATFVTLTKHEQLRGCIGSIEPRRPLVLDVRENAAAAATHDPRFPPVRPAELDDLKVEISILTPPEKVSYANAEELIDQLTPGVDGVIIERGWNRATFLPQVWEKLPQPRDFLQRLCLKAYLPADAYRQPGLDVYTYQVEKFEEDEPAG